MALQTIDTMFPDAKIYVPAAFEDDRGYFKETYNRDRYHAAGRTETFVQDSISFSTRNVIRGLHYDPEMAKLVSVLRGRVWDVIVDMRAESETYGRWQGFMLTEQSHKQLYVPAGFANGFIVLGDEVIFSYKHSAMHDPARERAVRWNDPTLAIPWPLVGEPRVSPKDALAPLFSKAT